MGGDADNQFDVGELEYFTAPVANHDVVIGFRVYRYDTVLRSILSWISGLTNRLLDPVMRAEAAILRRRSLPAGVSRLVVFAKS
jgi:hypothetical protein